ncbi:hypothetical protein QOZ80_2BG0171560 [Eleusine coracana subsp. coracana]|nr:hypothetical protein QOZ80_2BG0171560 [Eleusine coracana subsp. coracana]
MAVASRPLLVVHDEKQGHLIYDLLLDDGEEQTLACFPRPIVCFPFSLMGCASFAVSGGSILGPVPYDFWEDTIYNGTGMRVGHYDMLDRGGPNPVRDLKGRVIPWLAKARRFARSQGRDTCDYKHMPAMLPIGEDTVIRMDTILFQDIYQFEMLRHPSPKATGGAFG